MRVLQTDIAIVKQNCQRISNRLSDDSEGMGSIDVFTRADSSVKSNLEQELAASLSVLITRR